MTDGSPVTSFNSDNNNITIIGLYDPQEMSAGCYLHTHGLEQYYGRKELVISRVPFMFVPSGTKFLIDVYNHILMRNIRVFHGYCLAMDDIMVRFQNSIGCQGNRALEIRDHAEYYQQLDLRIEENK